MQGGSRAFTGSPRLPKGRPSGLAGAPKVASAPRGPAFGTLWATRLNPCRRPPQKINPSIQFHLVYRLQIHHASVNSALFHQFRMTALFCNLPGLHHQYPIGHSDGAEPVGHHHQGMAAR